MGSPRTLLASLLLLTCTPWLQADQAPPKLREAVSLYQRGMTMLRHGKVQDAREYLIKASNTLPGFPEAHVALGHIALQAADYHDALENYQTAISGFALLGNHLYDLRVDRYRSAQEQIRILRDELINIDNPRVKIRNREQRRIQIEGEIDKMTLVKLPSPGAGVEPPGELFFYRGNAEFHLGLMDKAIASWNTCAKESPSFPLVYNNLAVGYLKAGKPQEALASLQRAEELGIAIPPGLRRDIETAVAQHLVELSTTH